MRVIEGRMHSAWERLAARSDSWGTIASGVCLVHCVATPLVLSFSAMLNRIVPSEEMVHRVLAVVVLALGVAAAIGGYRRHRQWCVPVVMVVGLFCVCYAGWFGGRLGSPVQETLLTVAGSVLMMAGHATNHACCRRCR